MSDFEKLKAEFKRLEAENNSAKAKIDLYNEQLAKHGCKSIEEATNKIAKLEDKCESIAALIDELTAKAKGLLDDGK